MEKNYDDGNWCWSYECQYVDNTAVPSDYSYNIAFETPNGGYITGREISCRYWETDNLLQIIKEGSFVNFYVESFIDIEKILMPMIKSEKAIIYKKFESVNPIRKKRKEKLKHLAKLSFVSTLEKFINYIEKTHKITIDKEFWLNLQKEENDKN